MILLLETILDVGRKDLMRQKGGILVRAFVSSHERTKLTAIIIIISLFIAVTGFGTPDFAKLSKLVLE